MKTVSWKKRIGAVGDLVQLLRISNCCVVRVGHDWTLKEYRIQCWNQSGDLVSDTSSERLQDALETASSMVDVMQDASGTA